MVDRSEGQSTLAKAWARVCAFAWMNSEVLKNLRKDPKGTIEEIAEGKYGADDITQGQAAIIIELAEKTDESYSGYLPIPDPFKGLQKSSPEELKELLERGIAGALRFDKSAELWADALLQAWKNPELLKEIRKDPLGKLPRAKELQDQEYGIFPMPDRPRGLSLDDDDEIKIEQLENFLSDQDNIPHLGGIFPPMT